MKLTSTFLKLLLPLALAANTSLAEDKRTLTVYTYDSFTSEWGAGPKVKKAFEEKCDCYLEFVALDKAATLVNRIKLEGKNSKADVVLGLDTNLMAGAEATGLFAEAGVDTSAVKLPIEWNNKTFVPFDYGYFAFVYDTEAMKNPPQSMQALIESKEDFKIIVQDPRTSTPGLGLLLWIKSIYGDDAAAQWAKLKPRILSVTKGWSEAYFSMFLEGEAPMVLSYSTSPGYHMAIDKTERYQAASFKEGHFLQVEVAGILKSSDEPELAKEFLQFMLTSDFQSVLPLTNVMFPAIDIGDKMPEAFSNLIKPVKTLNLEPDAIRNNRKAWINEWLDAMSR